MKHSNLTSVTKAGRTKRPAASKKGFATAKRPNLKALFKAAREDVTQVNNTVCGLLEGRDALGGKAMESAYRFTIACMEQPAAAAKLPGWKEATVQPGANPYCQPVKLLAGDMDNSIQSRISIWAKVFANAHRAKIKPDEFLAHLKRNHGMRRWYDFINTSGSTTAGNDNHPGKASCKSGGAGGKGKDTKPAPKDIVAEARKAKRLGFVMVDMDALVCDANALAALESNPVVIGLVKAAPTKCRKFVAANDSRFINKGAA